MTIASNINNGTFSSRIISPAPKRLKKVVGKYVINKQKYKNK